MKKQILAILSLLMLIIGCSDKPVKWVGNGTKLEAIKYRLDISDSSKILVENGDVYSLLSPADSFIVNKFTINYSAVNLKADEYFRAKANQQVVNSINPKVTEYYQFDDGNVLLLGYSISDTLKPYTVFEPPLIISPENIEMALQSSTNNEAKVKSSGVMKTFIAENKAFDNGFNTSLTIRELKKIKLADHPNGNIVCSLREMVLSRDATVSYGENNLIMPEAIMLKTKLLLDQNGYPIAEWSIKTEKVETTEQTEKEPNRELYIEFTKYDIEETK